MNENRWVEIQEPSLQKTRFVKLPSFIARDASLSTSARLLYAILLDYAWSDDSCFPGQEKLSEELGCHRTSICGFVGELVDAGLLAVYRRGLGKTNVYTFLSFGRKKQNHDVSVGNNGCCRSQHQDDAVGQVPICNDKQTQITQTHITQNYQKKHEANGNIILRTPKLLPCDEPELNSPAKAILDAYQASVKPAHARSGAIEYIIGLLASGVSESTLGAGIAGYAAWCVENDKEPQYRFSAKRFFSESAHEDFKDFKSAKSATPPIDPVYQESRRRLVERELRKRNGKPAAAAQS